MVSYIKGGMQAKSIWKQGSEANILIQKDANKEWKRLHNEELHSLYRSTNIVRVIKSRRLRWAGHVARMEEGSSAFKILTGKPIYHIHKLPPALFQPAWGDKKRRPPKGSHKCAGVKVRGDYFHRVRWEQTDRTRTRQQQITEQEVPRDHRQSARLDSTFGR